MKLSVITINYNNALGLKKTVASVFDQTLNDFEYIVIDGGSTDGSKELIEENSSKLAYWVSEPDCGVYQAMNKGITKASGEYLLFLNSGDYLSNPQSLQAAFDHRFTESIVYGDIQSNTTGELIQFPHQLKFSHFYHATINHQASFIKRRLFVSYGLYNEAWKIASDWEFFIRCLFLYGETSLHLNQVITVFDFTDGISARLANLHTMKLERASILEQYFPGFEEDYRDMELLKSRIQERNQNSLKLNKHFVWLVRKIRNFFKNLVGNS